VHEDRLTDLLALALESHVHFANRLLETAGLPAADEIEVVTQVPTAEGRRVDLQILGYSAAGKVTRLWSENKDGARYQREQLPSYATALARFPERRRLITVVASKAEAPQDEVTPARWECLTWREIAHMALQAGRDSAGRPGSADWRTDAARPQAPASERILLEFVRYLEEEHGVVLRPLGHENVAAMAHIADTVASIRELLNQLSAAGTWGARLGGSFAMEAGTSDSWALNPVVESALGAGYSFYPGAKHADILLSEELESWRADLAYSGFGFSTRGAWVRVWRTKYLAELIPAGRTLDLQAQALAVWIDDTATTLAANDAGVG
jgi:hypothetical protein